MTSFETIAAISRDEARACADHPTWWWFAIPAPHRLDERAPVTSDGDDRFTLPYAGGDDTRLRKTAHRMALAICTSCPLAAVCAPAAFEAEAYGVWGGLTAAERYHLGGRAQVAAPRNAATAKAARLTIMLRFGPEHPVTQWVESLPDPKPSRGRSDLAAEAAADHAAESAA